MNYQVLKGLLLQFREDSLLYGLKTIIPVVWTIGRSLFIGHVS